MYFIVGSVIFFLIGCLAIWLLIYYIKAKRLHSYYSDILKKSGLNYKILPFNFFSMSFVKLKNEAFQKYGDCYYLRKTQSSKIDVELHNIFDKIVIILAKPDLLKEFYSQDKVYIYQKERRPIETIKNIFGHGIVFSEGKIWKQKRKAFSKVFNYDLIKANIPKVVALCDKCFDSYEQQLQISDGKYSFYILELIGKILVGIMLQNFFGCNDIDQNLRGKKIGKFISDLVKEAGLLAYDPLVVFLGKYAFDLGIKKSLRDVKTDIFALKQYARSLIQKRSKQIAEGKYSEVKTDLVESLHEQREKNKREGKTEEFEYTTQDLIDEFCTFLVAGTDTTSHLLMMMVYCVCDNPRIEERLRKEINELIKTDDDYTFENLKKLEYIDWIQLQTTRYYGPVTFQFLRNALVDNQIGNIPILKGTAVAIQLAGTHYNDDYYKNPHQFRPERWQSQCNNLHPYALLGFGGGPRTCIGKHLAFLSSKIMLIKLFKRYSKITVPKDRKMDISLVYYPNIANTIFEK